MTGWETSSILTSILHAGRLSSVWMDISEENHSKLLSLFRNVGLCFSISDTEELFPCNLPVGWPDREMWPPLPKPSEKQTSLLFIFSFLPPSFFPALIVAINKKRDSFPSNVQPLYYRFHIVYITKEQSSCNNHKKHFLEGVSNGNTYENVKKLAVSHRVHYEVTPHNNSLKITVRGPFPCCIIPAISLIVRSIQSSHFQGITYKEYLLCPECELKKIPNPAKFDLHALHDGICCKGHTVGNTEDILAGNFKSSDLFTLEVGQTRSCW